MYDSSNGFTLPLSTVFVAIFFLLSAFRDLGLFTAPGLIFGVVEILAGIFLLVRR